MMSALLLSRLLKILFWPEWPVWIIPSPSSKLRSNLALATNNDGRIKSIRKMARDFSIEVLIHWLFSMSISQ